MKPLALTLTAFLLFTGCNSFNTVEILGFPSYAGDTDSNGVPYVFTGLKLPEADLTPPEATDPVFVSVSLPTVQKNDGLIVCPVYKAPAIPKPPEVPYEAFKKLPPNDVEGLDRLTQKHIEDLRRYITKMRSDLIRSNAEYLNKCRSYVNATTGINPSPTKPPL